MKSKQEIEEDYKQISQIRKKSDKALQEINASLEKNLKLLKDLGYEIPSGMTFKESVEKVFQEKYGTSSDKFSAKDLNPQDAICLALMNALYVETTREKEAAATDKPATPQKTKTSKPSAKQSVLKFIRKGLKI